VVAHLKLRWVNEAVGNFRTYHSDSQLRNDRALQVYAKIEEAQALPTDRDLFQADARTRNASLCDAPAAVFFTPQARTTVASAELCCHDILLFTWAQHAEFTVGQFFFYGVKSTDEQVKVAKALLHCNLSLSLAIGVDKFSAVQSGSVFFHKQSNYDSQSD